MTKNKMLKLEQIQSLFTGTITKRDSKYVVTYPNSKKEYSYKCNLFDLAAKLKIDVDHLLSSENTYNDDSKQWKIITKQSEQSKLTNELIQNNIDRVSNEIKALNEYCKTIPYSFKEGEKSFTLFMVINLNAKTVSFEIKQTELFKSDNLPATQYKVYKRVCTLGNNFVKMYAIKTEDDLNRVIDNVIKSLK